MSINKLAADYAFFNCQDPFEYVLIMGAFKAGFEASQSLIVEESVIKKEIEMLDTYE